MDCTATNYDGGLKGTCYDDEHSEDYFTTGYNGKAYKRARTLFNLYAFDQINSGNDAITPTLIINKCDFKNFLVNMSSLINVQTMNIDS
jgi:hypothetical protein